MVIAVTGAAGRVGEFVVAELVDARARGRGRRPARALAERGVEYRRGDVEQVGSLVEAFAGCDAVVHLAAIAEAGIAPRTSPSGSTRWAR